MTRDWLDRLDLERRNGNVPGDQERVLRCLWVLVMSGDDQPSEARLWSEAGVSRSTVQRAKRTGRALGLLTWDRQWRMEGDLRRERPCAYRVEMPAGPVVRRPRRGRQVEARSVSLSRERQIAAVGILGIAQLAANAERMRRIAMGVRC